jgi:hypothetical protein
MQLKDGLDVLAGLPPSQRERIQRVINALEAKVKALGAMLADSNAAKRRGAEHLASMVQFQRHRDDWRAHAYGHRPRPADYLDSSLISDRRARWTSTERVQALEPVIRRLFLWVQDNARNIRDLEARAELKELSGAVLRLLEDHHGS